MTRVRSAWLALGDGLDCTNFHKETLALLNKRPWPTFVHPLCRGTDPAVRCIDLHLPSICLHLLASALQRPEGGPSSWPEWPGLSRLSRLVSFLADPGFSAPSYIQYIQCAPGQLASMNSGQSGAVRRSERCVKGAILWPFCGGWARICAGQRCHHHSSSLIAIANRKGSATLSSTVGVL
jgi:hypothetical protein